MKYLFFFILLICFYTHFSVAQNTERPKIALVLSGGGAKGFAHIGVLKVLEQEGIPVDIIVGTSIGSIVGGLYSIGYTAEEIEKIARSEDWDRLLADDISRRQLSRNVKNEKQRYIISLPVNEKYKPVIPQAVVNGQNIINLFCGLAGNVPKNADFSDFPVSYACIGTDMETGKEIVINHGFLPTAIYSSMTIPGIFLPIEHDGYLMLDGGIVNNFPTDVAKSMGADIIIGVDIRNNLHAYDEIVSMEQLMNQLINFYALKKDSANKSLCNILIRPDISGYNVYSFNSNAVDTLIRRGMEAAYSKIDEIKTLKSGYNLSAPQYDRQLTVPDKWKINKLTISGNYSMNDKLILDNISLNIPGSYSSEQIKNSIDKLYGSGFFKRVYFTIDQSEEGRVLNLILEEQPSNNINVGMRINTTEAVSVLLNYTQKDYRRFLGLISVTADISSNPGFNIQTEFSKRNLPVVGLQLDGKYNKYNVFYNQRRYFSTEIYYGAASVYTYKNIKNTSVVGLGLKEEYYKGNIYSIEIDTTLNASKNQITTFNLFTFFSVDNLDNYYFPARGTELYAEFSLSTNEEYKSISPIVLFKNRNIFALSGKIHLLINFYGRAVFSDIVHQYKQTYVGGTDYSIYFNSHLPFYGLPSITPMNKYTFIGCTGLRFETIKNHFISLFGNGLIDNNEISPLTNYSTILGTAISYSFNSRFGPLDLTVGYSDGYNKLTFSANFGYWF